MTKIKELQKAIASKEVELANIGSQKPQFLIEEDDEYQDNLELGWAKDEIRDEIKSLKESLVREIRLWADELEESI